MNKQELKRILKPLIKECIKEVIFEDGALSSIVSEVMKGVSPQTLVEQKKEPVSRKKVQEDHSRKLMEQKKKMLDAIGRDAYNGVNLFEGTTPAPAQNDPSHGPLSGTNSNDPGVDISNFSNNAMWKKLAGN